MTTYGCSDHINIDHQCPHYALCLKPATITIPQDASNSKKKESRWYSGSLIKGMGEGEKKVPLPLQVSAGLD